MKNTKNKIILIVILAMISYGFVVAYSYYDTRYNYPQMSVVNMSEIESNFTTREIKESEKEIVMKLLPQKDNQIYFGAFPDFGDSEDNVTVQRIEEFNELAGRQIAWAYFSNNWGTDGIVFPREKVEIIASTGAIPFIRMMPRKFFDTKYDKTFSLQKIIDGDFDDYLHQYAKDVKEYSEPLLIDFAVEMNGDWFPWSGVINGGAEKTGYGDIEKADGPEKFVDAYRHIIDIFRDKEVKNVTWFFHPDVYSYPENQTWNAPKEYYPGDDYIDWIGISIYGPQNPNENYWQLFSEIIAEREKEILAISDSKPLALLEFGVTDQHPLGTKTSWIMDAMNTILDKDNPVQFKAISWWHENWEEEDGLWATLRIDSSPASRALFSKFMIDSSRFSSQILVE